MLRRLHGMLCSKTVTTATATSSAIAGVSAVTAIAARPAARPAGAPVASDTPINAAAAAIPPRLRVSRLWVWFAMGRVCECLQPKGHRRSGRFGLARNREGQRRPALWGVYYCMATLGLWPRARVADSDLYICRVGDAN